jgi:hypothetical protein
MRGEEFCRPARRAKVGVSISRTWLPGFGGRNMEARRTSKGAVTKSQDQGQANLGAPPHPYHWGYPSADRSIIGPTQPSGSTPWRRLPPRLLTVRCPPPCGQKPKPQVWDSRPPGSIGSQECSPKITSSFADLAWLRNWITPLCKVRFAGSSAVWDKNTTHSSIRGSPFRCYRYITCQLRQLSPAM